MKSVVFIEPAAKLTNVFDSYMRMPLLGTLYLGTILHERGYDVRIYNENVLGRRVDPFEVQADVYCLSALTPSASRAKLLAGQLRASHPGAHIIVGGIHASLLPDEFAGVADHVVCGEAESIIEDLVEGRCTTPIVQGKMVEDLEALPPTNYGLVVGHEDMDTVPIMTSRGCPFDCNFCTVTRIFGRGYRMQSPARVLAEVKHALSYFTTRDVFFYDDNLTANRQRIIELCELLIAEGVDLRWTAQVRSDAARDPELVRLMARAGCRWVCVGFESIDDATLAALHKHQTRADIERAIATFHDAGINVHGMFIFGEDHDTVTSLRRTVEFTREQRVDTAQFMILTPFPGTRLYDDMVAANRIIHCNWDYYNGMFTVFPPRHMGPLRLQEETYRAYRDFYSPGRTSLELLGMLGRVGLDALTWNFGAAGRHRFESKVVRLGATAIIGRYTPIQEAYLRFLGELETQRVTGQAPAAPAAPAAGSGARVAAPTV